MLDRHNANGRPNGRMVVEDRDNMTFRVKREVFVSPDILFDEHRRWAEQMCEAAGLTAVEPLFGSSTLALFEEWTDSGADALIVTARAELLDQTWLGRPLRRDMLDSFTRLGVDPCGERGEYHTVVTNSPLFSNPVLVQAGVCVQRSGCWALDLVLCAR